MPRIATGVGGSAGWGRSQLSELKQIVAELELDKLNLRASLNHPKPRACPQRNSVRSSLTQARSWQGRIGGRVG